VTPLKCTPNWDDLGWGGIPREGGGGLRRFGFFTPGGLPFVQDDDLCSGGCCAGRHREIGSSGDLVIGKPEIHSRGRLSPHEGRKRNEPATLSCEIVWIVLTAPAEILSPDQLLSGL
jgi:hypothetical protein